MKFANIVASALLSVAFSVGCDKNAGVAGEAETSELRLGFFPNVTHAQAVLGVTSGEFASAVAPAKFTPRQFNAGPSLIEALFAKQVDVGYIGPGPTITAYARTHGEGIRVISGAAANGVLIVARTGSGIVQMSDLKGRKIASPQTGNTQDIAARHYLTSVLHQTDTTNVLAISNTDQFGMMQSGAIDAAWAPEPWASLLVKNAGATVVGEEKDLWPDHEFSLTVIVTTPEFLAAHADVLSKLLAVNHSWTEKLNKDPASCVPQLQAGLATLSGKSLPISVISDAVSHVKFTEQALEATFTANAQWAFDLGVSKQKTDVAGLIDLSLLKKLPN